jgi:hypothetical protein
VAFSAKIYIGKKAEAEVLRSSSTETFRYIPFAHPTFKMKTTWKDIAPVPNSTEFLDIVLSRTQRRLPTQIRSGFQISRIRAVRLISAEREKI